MTGYLTQLGVLIQHATDQADFEPGDAQRALRELRDAHLRLRADNPEVVTAMEWATRLTYTDGRDPDVGLPQRRGDAELAAETLITPEYCAKFHIERAEVVRRIVRTFRDGTIIFDPWTPVPTGGKDSSNG